MAKLKSSLACLSRGTRRLQKMPAQAHSRRILCVDDEPATLKARKLLLETAGYSVETATSGAQALEMLEKGTKADLVLLDFMLGEMKGDELAITLRKRYPALRLVAVSAVETLPPSLLNAVDDRVRKAQSPEILLSVVARVLDRPAGGVAGMKSASSPTVLCVEDEQLQLQMRRMLFESAGFIVFEARTAGAAMDIFRSQRIDAVLMDYWLSGTNGTKIAEEMKRLNPRTPIIMLSGFSSLPGEGTVVDAWLRKGEVAPEDIINEVQRLIGFQTDTKTSVS